MNKISIIKSVRWPSVFLCLVQFFGAVYAQGNQDNFIIPKTNSKSNITQMVAATRIEIIYHRPNKRGRVIFGDLVPYGKIWRTGSDDATELYFSTPVKLAGQEVDSGRYELFTIPDSNQWEIILQQHKNQWGSYSYQMENDVVRFSVVPRQIQTTVETFTISVDQITTDGGILNISWDDLVVPIPLSIDLKTTVIPRLEKALLKEGRRPYFHAAMFYFENDLNIDCAAELMSLALKEYPGHIGMLYRQALILRAKGDVEHAIRAAQQSLAGAKEADLELRTEYTRLNSALLKELNAEK